MRKGYWNTGKFIDIFLPIILAILTAILIGTHFFLKKNGWLAIGLPKLVKQSDHLFFPHFTADSKLQYWNPKKRQICTIDLLVTKAVRCSFITQMPNTNPIDLIWSPTGRSFVLITGTEKKIIALESTEEISIPYRAQKLTWSTDGEKLAWQIMSDTNQFTSKIFVADLKTGAISARATLDRSMSPFTNGSINLGWLPDGTLLYSDIVLDESSATWYALPPQDQKKVLVETELVSFSPDNKQLLFTRPGNGNNEDIWFYGIINLANDTEEMTPIQSDSLCGWKTNTSLGCLAIRPKDGIVTIGEYDLQTQKYRMMGVNRISADALPNNLSLIFFDFKKNRVYYISKQDNNLYYLEY